VVPDPFNREFRATFERFDERRSMNMRAADKCQLNHAGIVVAKRLCVKDDIA
jgi:hypothetical protein